MRTLQTTRCFRKKAGSVTQRSKRGRPAPPVSTHSYAADAFLTHCFEPVRLLPDEDEDDCLHDQIGVESAFFTSLGNLAALYGWPMAELLFDDLVYPLNIARSLDAATQCLTRSQPHLQLLVVQDDQHVATLATAATYSLCGGGLCVLPLRGYYELLRTNRHSARTTLLTAIFGYLHQVADIHHFADRNGYYSDQYAQVIEYAREQLLELNGLPPDEQSEEDEDRESFSERIQQGEEAIRAGEHTLTLLTDRVDLDTFAQRLDCFVEMSRSDRMLTKIARQTLDLYRQYPHRSIQMSCALTELLEDDTPDYRIPVDEYLAFIWDDADSLWDEIEQNLHCDFDNGGSIDEPLQLQFFDKPQAAAHHCFDFEEKLMHIVHQLVDYLFLAC